MKKTFKYSPICNNTDIYNKSISANTLDFCSVYHTDGNNFKFNYGAELTSLLVFSNIHHCGVASITTETLMFSYHTTV